MAARLLAAAFALAATLGGCGDSPVSPPAGRPELREVRQLTDDSVEQFLPADSGDVVAWERETPDGGRRVVLLDLATGERRPVTDASSEQRVSGRRVVWTAGEPDAEVWTAVVGRP